LAILSGLRVATPAVAQLKDPPAAAKTPETRFVMVNGLRLHYPDWGGAGEAMLLLAALGGTAGDFQPLAVHFTNRFHVLGLILLAIPPARMAGSRR